MEYIPSTPQKFWCRECDLHIVDSENPTTGKFFVMFGSAYNKETKEYDGEYTGVMYAICSHCRPN